jgi:hypothetical protein
MHNNGAVITLTDFLRPVYLAGRNIFAQAQVVKDNIIIVEPDRSAAAGAASPSASPTATGN